MGKAARAIIIEKKRILVMHRNKVGNQYFTLVGGRVDINETIEDALVREVKEETGLQVTSHRLVYTESHREPYNEQYIFLCEVAPHTDNIAVQEDSEEGLMNKYGDNTHTVVWAHIDTFKDLHFITPQIQSAINLALKKGFPKEPIAL